MSHHPFVDMSSPTYVGRPPIEPPPFYSDLDPINVFTHHYKFGGPVYVPTGNVVFNSQLNPHGRAFSSKTIELVNSARLASNQVTAQRMRMPGNPLHY